MSTFHTTPTPPLVLNDHHLKVVPSVKVLGLWVQGNLKWKQQVNQMLSTASQRLHVLHRLKRFGAGGEDLVTIYKTYI